MSIEDAKFVVQRGSEQFKCKGEELQDKLQTGDLLAVQHSSDGTASKWTYPGNVDDILDTDWLCCTDGDSGTFKVRGDKFKELFEIKYPWDTEYNKGKIFHLLNLTDTIYFRAKNYLVWPVSKKPDATADQLQYEWGDEYKTMYVYPGEEIVFAYPGPDSDAEGLFAGNMTANWDFGELTDVSKITGFKGFFRDCKKFNSPIDQFDVSSATNMERMFGNCNSFNQDLNSWDTSNVETMLTMFIDCHSFNGDIGSWDTSKVTTMRTMFYNTNVFNKDISKWDVSKVADMDFMFKEKYGNATAFNQDLSQWCVSQLPAEPDTFSNSANWTLPKPVWGTCPRGEDTP